MRSEPELPRLRSEGQVFLIGPKLYLRPVELEDAATSAIWSPSPFPAPAEVIEDRLKQQLESDPDSEDLSKLMIICRRSDDRPVGSVRIESLEYRRARLVFRPDNNLSSMRQSQIIAEVLTFLVPWMIDERNQMTIVFSHPGEDPIIEATTASLGMRRFSRRREAVLHDGRRADLLSYQAFNPFWVETLGMPRDVEEGPVERSVQSPAPLQWNRPEGDLPAAAIMVGERLYLRAFNPDESAQVSRWLLQDTEVYYPTGRWVPNPHTYGHTHKVIAEKEPPEWLRFAIVLLETDELIGANGLDHLDLVNRTAETETELFRPLHRSQGYGTEAKHLLLEYAFERLGLHMVWSWVDEPNTRSAAALRKQGYRDCGYYAWADFYKNGLSGGLTFDLLADEWRAARR